MVKVSAQASDVKQGMTVDEMTAFLVRVQKLGAPGDARLSVDISLKGTVKSVSATFEAA